MPAVLRLAFICGRISYIGQRWPFRFLFFFAPRGQLGIVGTGGEPVECIITPLLRTPDAETPTNGYGEASGNVCRLLQSIIHRSICARLL